MWAQSLLLSQGEWRADGKWQPERCDLVLMFGPTDLLLTSGASAQIAAQCPNATVIGCSTGTSIVGGRLSDDNICAVAVGFEKTKIRLATRTLGGAEESADVGRRLGRDLASPDLAAVFVLSGGLTVNGSALVDGLLNACGPSVAISGGLAGDGARFSNTLVSVNGEASGSIVAAVGFYGDAIRVSNGSAGGWDQFGPLRKITKSVGNVLHELDGKPALDLYEKYLGEEAAGLPASALFYPLKIWDPAHPEDEVVRTVLSIDREARTMTFAGDVPQGWSVRLMRGSFDRLVDGATEAARHALQGLDATSSSASLCLLVSCVGRRLLMGQRTEDEVEAVRAAIGAGIPIAGFYSYGEIAPNNRTGISCLHNQTVTLTLLSEAV